MTRRKVVAIHQPNFFPWLGYFDKIARADLFVLLDNVQFPKKGGTWTNRVRLLVNGRPEWVTMPVVRAHHGVRAINEMQIDNSAPWRNKVLSVLRTNYGHAPHFDQVFPILEELVENPTDRVADYNQSVIKTLTTRLGLDSPKLVVASTLDVEGQATDLLIAIVRAVEGTAYLCGGGAAEYQEDAKFAAAGLDLIYQNFQHPIYRQDHRREFIPGLSIIDALMHCSFAGTAALIGAGPGESLESIS
jgi:hypothetical protein